MIENMEININLGLVGMGCLELALQMVEKN
jgi:hypothetical protein